MSPIRSCPNSAWVGMPKISLMFDQGMRDEGKGTKKTASTSSFRLSPSSFVLLDERAAAFLLRPERLLGGGGAAQLVVVPRTLRFGGFLDLEQIHVVDLAPVLAYAALAEGCVVRGQLLHLGDDLVAVGIGLQRLHRLQVVQHAGIDTGLSHGRHGALVQLREA